MKRMLVALLVSSLLLLPGGSPALAQGQQEQQDESPAESRLGERWDTVRQRIELLITRFENSKERHVEAYNQAKGKVRELMEALQDRGYDVTRLAEDLSTWDGMIAKFAQDYATFIHKLEETLGLEAEQLEGRLKPLLQEARQLLRQVHADALDIKPFYQQTIRADVQDLRGQVPAG